MQVVINSNWVECLKPVCSFVLWAFCRVTQGQKRKGTGERKKRKKGEGGAEKMEDVCKSTSMTDFLNQISGYLFTITD